MESRLEMILRCSAGHCMVHTLSSWNSHLVCLCVKKVASCVCCQWPVACVAIQWLTFRRRQLWNINGNSAHPQKAIKVGKAAVYESAHLTGAGCICRNLFGGDAHQSRLPCSSDSWEHGREYAQLLSAAFATHSLRVQIIYKRLAFLSLLNHYSPTQGIDYRSDYS